MTENIRKFFDPRITLGNLITIALLLVGTVGGYVRLEARQTAVEKSQDAAAKYMREHEEYDNQRFRDYATKETRSVRDAEVDRRFSDIEKQLDSVGVKLDNIIAIHLKR